MAKIVARTMKRRERILLIYVCDVQYEDVVDGTFNIW
jgi:hypothetical protein